MTLLPLLLFWSIAIWGVFSRKPVLLYLFFGSIPFGSVAAIPSGITGGLTLTPTPITALLIIIRVLGNTKGLNFLLTAALTPNRLLLLFLFWVVAVLTTIFSPRLFAGAVQVIPVRGTLTGSAPLFPTSQNFSQLTYLTISILTVFAFARLLRSERYRWHMLRAIVLGGVLVVVTGLIDFTSQFLPIRFLLEPFRTATYALLTDVEVLGGKRVIGLMPEASSFGGVCLNFLAFLYFFRAQIEDRNVRDRYVPILLVLLLFLLWQATSSSGYVGLAILALCAVMDWCRRATARQSSLYGLRVVTIEFWLAFAALVAVVAVIVFHPSTMEPFMATLDRMVFKKTSSYSYEQRNMWTDVSWKAALQTYGFGLGLGATRPSNSIVAVFSSTGFVGAFLYYAFIAMILLTPGKGLSVFDRRLLSSVIWTFVPPFIIATQVGTTADFGLMNAFRFGLISALLSIRFSTPVPLSLGSSPSMVGASGR